MLMKKKNNKKKTENLSLKPTTKRKQLISTTVNFSVLVSLLFRHTNHQLIVSIIDNFM